MALSFWNYMAVLAMVVRTVAGEYVCFYQNEGCTIAMPNIPCLVGPPNTGEW